MKSSFSKSMLYICLVSILATSLAPLRVLAVVDTGFYSANDILFYNPDDTGCTGSSGSSTGADSSSSDPAYKERLETTLKFLTGKGLSLAAAAGIAGNLKVESGIVPTRVQNTSPSYKAPDNYTPVSGVGFGIAQWTSGGRQKALLNYAKSKSKNITDLDTQLEHLWNTSVDKKSMMKALNSVKSDTPYRGVAGPVAAAIIFHGKTKQSRSNATVAKVNPPNGYEASGNTGEQVVNNRGGAATKIFNDYNGKISDGTGVSGAGADTSSSSTGAIGGCGAVAGDIVQTGTNFALDKPDTDQHYKVGDYTQSTKDANPAYITALDKYNNGANPADCGIFVATVVIASGADTKYPKAGTSSQLSYVMSHPEKYTILENIKRSDLQPGDILIVNNDSGSHHTLIYTGDSTYPIVEASEDNRVPSVQDEEVLNWMLKQTGVIAARLIQ